MPFVELSWIGDAITASAHASHSGACTACVVHRVCGAPCVCVCVVQVLSLLGEPRQVLWVHAASRLGGMCVAERQVRNQP